MATGRPSTASSLSRSGSFNTESARRCFALYGEHGSRAAGMSGQDFSRFCRECQMLSKSFAKHDAELLFVKVCGRHRRRIDFDAFLDAVDVIGWRQAWSTAELERHLSGDNASWRRGDVSATLSTVDRALSAARSSATAPPPPPGVPAPIGRPEQVLAAPVAAGAAPAIPTLPWGLSTLLSAASPSQSSQSSPRGVLSDTEERVAKLEGAVRKCLPLVHEVAALQADSARLTRELEASEAMRVEERTRLSAELNATRAESEARAGAVAQLAAAREVQQRDYSALLEAHEQLRDADASGMTASGQRSARRGEQLRVERAQVARLTSRLAALQACVDSQTDRERASQAVQSAADGAIAHDRVCIALLEADLSTSAAKRVQLDAAVAQAGERITLLELHLSRSEAAQETLRAELRAVRLGAAAAAATTTAAPIRQSTMTANATTMMYTQQRSSPLANAPQQQQRSAVRVNRHGSVQINTRAPAALASFSPQKPPREPMALFSRPHFSPLSQALQPAPAPEIRTPMLLLQQSLGGGALQQSRAGGALQRAVHSAFSSNAPNTVLVSEPSAPSWDVPDSLLRNSLIAQSVLPLPRALPPPMQFVVPAPVAPLTPAPIERSSLLSRVHVNRHGSVQLTVGSAIAAGAEEARRPVTPPTPEAPEDDDTIIFEAWLSCRSKGVRRVEKRRKYALASGGQLYCFHDGAGSSIEDAKKHLAATDIAEVLPVEGSSVAFQVLRNHIGKEGSSDADPCVCCVCLVAARAGWLHVITSRIPSLSSLLAFPASHFPLQPPSRNLHMR